MPGSKYVFCPYCNYSTVRFFTRKDGTLSGPGEAIGRLQYHIERKHQDKLRIIEDEMEHYDLTKPDEDYDGT